MLHILKIILITVLITTSINAIDTSIKGELLIQMIQTKDTNRILKRNITNDKLNEIIHKYNSIVDTILKSDVKIKSTNSRSLSKNIIKEKILIKVSDIKQLDMKDMIKELKAVDNIQFVEPNYIFKTDDFDTPLTNPKSADQWYINKNNTKEAWGLFGESDLSKLGNVVVAVLDSGVDYTHEDLKDAMWINSGEIPANGIDDDKNGYVDDVYGANVLYKTLNNTPNAKDSDPKDDHGHGTHVAGIIGAVNNDIGIIGVASGVKIMAIKCARADGSLTTSDIVKALNYAKDMGAHVANMSFGGGMHSNILENALADLSATATLVASAGNSHKPLELDKDNTCGMLGIKPVPNYPAAYPFVLGVEASDSNGALAGFSNCDPKPYSPLEYEVRMPGVAIMSTLPGNAYAAWNGTSMAAPIASGLAALIKAKQWDNADVYTNRMMQAQVAKYASNFQDALTKLPKPDLKYFSHAIFDSNATAGNDGDGLADAGEIVKLAIKIKNYWGAAKDIKLKVSPGFTIHDTSTFSADSYVTIKNGDSSANGSITVDLPQIGSYTIGDNGIVADEYGNITDVTIPIELIIDSEAPNLHRAVFTMELEYKNSIDTNDTTVYTSSKKFSFDLQNGIEVQGIIDDGTVWRKNSRIIVKDSILIAEGTILTIEDGVEVLFDSLKSMRVDGTLIVNGTKQNKVLFSNLSKDYESDKNNLRWDGITFSGNNNKSNINFAIFENSNTQIIKTLCCEENGFIIENSIFRNLDVAPSGNGIYNGCIINLAPLSVYTSTLNIKNTLVNNLETKWDLLYNRWKVGTVYPGDRAFFGINYNKTKNSVINFNKQQTGERLFVVKNSPNKKNIISPLIDKIYIAGDRSLFRHNIYTYDDGFDREEMIYLGNTNEEMLAQTMPTPPSTTPAFLVSAKWLDNNGEEKQILEVGSTYKLQLIFNKEKMQTSIQPLVTFGSLSPFTDKLVEGDWLDDDANGLAKVWEAKYTITTHSGTGENTIRVTGAFDDDMYYDAPKSETYKFSIVANGAQAMVLQAIGQNGKAAISWMQDDYEMVGGYNIYRSNTQDGTYIKVNQAPILGLTYEDSNVDAGKTYYYTFRAILSDGTLSPDSNIASATILDNIKPTITHTPILKVNPGNSKRVTAIITDNIEISSVKIYYRIVGAGAFIEANMVATSVSNQYAFTIATSYFSEGSDVEYKIIATDNSGNSETLATNTIHVTNGDIAPSIGQVADISVVEGSSSFDIDLNILDADGDSMTITAESSDGSIAIATLNYNQTKLTITPQSGKYGDVMVEVKATNSLETIMTFKVSITHSDTLPHLDAIDNISKLKDFKTFTIPINATDSDGDTIVLSIENSNDNIVTAKLNGNEITISSIAYAIGQSTIKVTATANGKSVSREFLLEVMLSDNGSTQTYNYQLNEGWNLIGFLPQNSIDNLPNELKDSTNVRIVWKYDNQNQSWKGYSPISTISSQLDGRQIVNINATDGVWVNCKKSTIVSLNNPPVPTMISNDIVVNYSWNLVSSPNGNTIDPSSFENASILWKYNAGIWSVFSNDSNIIKKANDLNISIIDNISGSEGFWINRVIKE
jgi:hypothetical protein